VRGKGEALGAPRGEALPCCRGGDPASHTKLSRPTRAAAAGPLTSSGRRPPWAHLPWPGNLLGLLLSPFILVTFGWRALFLVFGVLGAPLLAVWNAAVPDKPSAPQQPPSSAAAAAAAAGGGAAAAAGGAAPGGGVTLLKLLSHPATWAIIVVNFVNHWGYFIYLNWMPTYFSKVTGGRRLGPRAGEGLRVGARASATRWGRGGRRLARAWPLCVASAAALRLSLPGFPV
jgi:hypothetical protein